MRSPNDCDVHPTEPCPSCGATTYELGLLAARDEIRRATRSGEGLRPLIYSGDFAELEALIDAYRTGALRGLDFARLVEIVSIWAGAIRQWEDDGTYYRTAHPPAVIQDTREQKPWTPMVLRITPTGPKMVPCPISVQGLDAGDYALFDTTGLPPGCKAPLVIERKSAADLYGTMLTGRERFLSMWSEACRLFERRFLIIESTLEGFEKYRWQRCLKRESEKDGLNAEKLFDQQKKGIHNGLLAIMLDFGVQVIWCDGVEEAERMGSYLMDRVARQLTDPKEKKKARERGVHRSAPWIGEP